MYICGSKYDGGCYKLYVGRETLLHQCIIMITHSYDIHNTPVGVKWIKVQLDLNSNVFNGIIRHKTKIYDDAYTLALCWCLLIFTDIYWYLLIFLSHWYISATDIYPPFQGYWYISVLTPSLIYQWYWYFHPSLWSWVRRLVKYLNEDTRVSHQII